MKKTAAWLAAIMLVSSMTVPAYAYSGDVGNTSSNSATYSWWNGAAASGSTASVKNTPVIKEAKFYHSGYTAAMKNRLQIQWEAVSGAESYQIQVTKADGTQITYTATGTTLVVKGSQCPKLYSKASGIWEAATVRVRAVTKTGTGSWSKQVTIGCDKIH